MFLLKKEILQADAFPHKPTLWDGVFLTRHHLTKKINAEFDLKGLGFKQNVFNFFLKASRDRLLSCIKEGRKFQVEGQEQKNPRGPNVFVEVRGTDSSPEAAERRRERPGTSARRVQHCDKYSGARPCWHL